MKKTILLALSLVAVIGVGTLGYNYYMEKIEQEEVELPAVTQEKGKSQEPQKSAADLNFDMLRFEGGARELADFYGEQPIVLNFWASTCPPCVYEMPIFQKKYEEYGDEITFLMVNVPDFNGESEHSARQFVKDNNYNFPTYFEIEYGGSENFGTTSIPQTFFLNPQGEIVDSHIGAMTDGQLTKAIKTLLE